MPEEYNTVLTVVKLWSQNYLILQTVFVQVIPQKDFPLEFSTSETELWKQWNKNVNKSNKKPPSRKLHAQS